MSQEAYTSVKRVLSSRRLALPNEERRKRRKVYSKLTGGGGFTGVVGWESTAEDEVKEGDSWQTLRGASHRRSKKRRRRRRRRRRKVYSRLKRQATGNVLASGMPDTCGMVLSPSSQPTPPPPPPPLAADTPTNECIASVL